MRINAVISEVPASIASTSALLGKLQPGETIKAMVMDASSETLLLRLSDGTTVRAAASEGLNIEQGKSIELLLRLINNGTYIMETVKQNHNSRAGSISNDLAAKLIENGIKPESTNIILADLLKQSGIEITKSLIDNATALLDKFSGITPEKAVFLSSKGIEHSNPAAGNAIRLLEGTLKLGIQLSELASILNKYTTSTNSTNNDADSIAIDKKGASTVINTQVGNSSETSKKGSSFEPVATISLDSKGTAKPGISGLEVSDQTRTVKSTVGQVQIRIKETTLETASASNPQKEASQTFQTLGNTAASSAKSGQEIQVKLQVGTVIPPDSELLSAPQVTDITKVTDITNSMISLTDKSSMILLTDNGSGKPDGSQNDRIDSSTDNKTLVKLANLKEDINQLFIKIGEYDSKTELELKNLYKNMHDKLDSLIQAASLLPKDVRNDINTRISNIDEGVRLMSQIANPNTYIQIPLNISGYNTTGELYIFKKDRHKKRIDPQNVIVLISLDTLNIGQIESLIDIKGKNISVNFRVENQLVIDFLKESYRHLYNGLLERGYRLSDVKYRLGNEKSGIDEQEKVLGKHMNNIKTAFDRKI